MYLNHRTNYNSGDLLEAVDWNHLASDVNELGARASSTNTGTNTGGSSSSVADEFVKYDSTGKHNLTIETTSAHQYTKNGEVKGGKINIESVSDIQVKPGDDIILYSHHREEGKQDEVAVKVTDGDDVPVKLQLNAAEMLLSTKDKTGNNANVFDVTVNSGKNTRGYLKVRAQAIDLRSESHGGIALQPKGSDGQGNMNKIKFEHGGGDGLEFGTFNAEKTSIFTDEYRFNREGVWKMATRTKEVSDKYDDTDETTHYKYVKAADDFYDNIAQDDEQCTTKDIIKTAFAMNGGKDRHTKITNDGDIEIATDVTYVVVIEQAPVAPATATEINSISTKIAALSSVTAGDTFNVKDFNKSGSDYSTPTASTVYTNGTQYFSFTEVAAPSIKIDSGSKLKLGGILDFGSTFNFGETDGGIEYQYKLTKKNATKDCGVLKVVGVNNHATNDLTVEGVTIAPGQTGTIAQCSMLDIIKLVNYMKTNEQGPWAPGL